MVDFRNYGGEYRKYVKHVCLFQQNIVKKKFSCIWENLLMIFDGGYHYSPYTNVYI